MEQRDNNNTSVQASIARLVQAKQRERTLYPRTRDHQCARGQCNPENEPALIARGVLRGPPVNPTVYLCNWRAIHVCTATRCELYRDSRVNACPVSGITHNATSAQITSYDKNDPLTWRTRPQHQSLQKRGRVQVVAHAARVDRNALLCSGKDLFNRNNDSEQQQQQQEQQLAADVTNSDTDAVVKPKASKKRDVLRAARDIVHRLLFSSTRERLNREFAARCMRSRNSKRDMYLRECVANNQFPVLPMLVQIDAYHLNRTPPFVEFEFNEVTREHYARIIQSVWLKVLDFADPAEQIRLDSVALATLYMMRVGYTPNGMACLPLDTFLLEHLPVVNSLDHFGFEKRYVTNGEALLTRMYNRALELGVSEDDIGLDVRALQTSAVRDGSTRRVEAEELFFKSVSRKRRR